MIAGAFRLQLAESIGDAQMRFGAALLPKILQFAFALT
jgi:hypothetical protein